MRSVPIVSEYGCRPFRLRTTSPTASPAALFTHVIDRLIALAPVYIHVIEGATGGDRNFVNPFDYVDLRRRFRGTYIANNGYTLDLAKAAIETDRADLVAFDKAFLANPDLVTRLRVNAPLNTPDRATFYGGGDKGYTDYPALDAEAL
jgi:N-ethylmaleimide reductase